MPSGRDRWDDDDRPRRRDRYDDDRPRSRRDDPDDQPRPRRRYEEHWDDDDDDDRPRRTRPRPRGRRTGSNVGLWVGLGLGALALVVLTVVVLVVVIGGVGLFGSSVDYAKYQSISGSDSLEGLEKKFGQASKMSAEDVRQLETEARAVFNGGGDFTNDLLGNDPFRNDPFNRGRFGGRPLPQPAGDPFQARGLDVYQWRRGAVRVLVVVDTKGAGKGLRAKLYFDSDAARRNQTADPAKVKPMYEYRTL